jgi:putative pyruvate formate lyase activating enzyme
MADPLLTQAARLQAMLESCELCPRRCRVDRTGGERGVCGLGASAVVASALVHHGEEPPLSGSRGAGTIFLASCNLGCPYCQNYQISRGTAGTVTDDEGLAEIMQALEKRGCHNVEAVTPTPQAPRIAGALLAARRRGFALPFVYNCGGYENPEVIRLLDRFVEIYLPDFKYGLAEAALGLGNVPDYVPHALASLREMVRQVGDALELREGVAARGLLVRHLVLPGHVANSLAVLKLIRENVSTAVPLSLMSQYTPVPAVKDHPDLGRRITRDEYNRVVDAALDWGFSNLFIQDVDDRELTPDFDRESPFRWS